jgi:hypothetical protein
LNATNKMTEHTPTPTHFEQFHTLAETFAQTHGFQLQSDPSHDKLVVYKDDSHPFVHIHTSLAYPIAAILDFCDADYNVMRRLINVPLTSFYWNNIANIINTGVDVESTILDEQETSKFKQALDELASTSASKVIEQSLYSGEKLFHLRKDLEGTGGARCVNVYCTKEFPMATVVNYLCIGPTNHSHVGILRYQDLTQETIKCEITEFLQVGMVPESLVQTFPFHVSE